MFKLKKKETYEERLAKAQAVAQELFKDKSPSEVIDEAGGIILLYDGMCIRRGQGDILDYKQTPKEKLILWLTVIFWGVDILIILFLVCANLGLIEVSHG